MGLKIAPPAITPLSPGANVRPLPVNPQHSAAFRQLQIESGAIPNVSEGPFAAITKTFTDFIPPKPLVRTMGDIRDGAFIFAGNLNLPRIQLRIGPANTRDYLSSTLAYGSDAAVKAKSVRFAVMFPTSYTKVLAGEGLAGDLSAEDYGFFFMSPPSEMQTTFEPNTSIQEGRKQSVANYLGRDLASSSFSGATRAWYLRNLGLTNLFRDQTHSYRNFMEFLTLFLLNGRVLHGSEGVVNLTAPERGNYSMDQYERGVHFVAAGQMDPNYLYPIVMEKARSSAFIRLTVGHLSLLGKFKTLRYSQEGPSNFVYNFDMDVVDLTYEPGVDPMGDSPISPLQSAESALLLKHPKKLTRSGLGTGLHLIPQQRAECISRDFLVLFNTKDVGIDIKSLGAYRSTTDYPPLKNSRGELMGPREDLNTRASEQRADMLDGMSLAFKASLSTDPDDPSGTAAAKALALRTYPDIPETGFEPGGLIAQKLPSENPNYSFIKQNLFSTTSLNSRLASYNIDVSLEESSFNMGFALTDIETYAFMKFQSLPVKQYSEFELWETGRFMVKDKDVHNPADYTTPYYKRFWGIVKGRGLQKSSTGSNVLSIKGDSMMWFLKASEFPIGVSIDATAMQLFWGQSFSSTDASASAPAATTPAGVPGATTPTPAGGTTPTASGTSSRKSSLDWAKMNLQSWSSANMNVFELVMFAIDRTVKYAVLPSAAPVMGELGGTTGKEQFKARKIDEWETERAGIGDWWKKRLETAVEGFRIYGVTDVRTELLTTNANQNNTQALGYTAATLDTEYLTLFCPKWVDAVNNTFMDQEKITAYDYIKGITQSIGMEFYTDVDGSIVMKFPFYNLNVFEYAPFNIELVDIVDWTYEDDMENVKTFVEVRGHVKPSETSTFGANAFYIDKRLADTFGLKGESIEVPFVKNAFAAELYAISYMDLVNLSAYSLRLTIKSRPELHVGFPVYVKHLDVIGYVSAISRSGAIGSNADMDVTLTALRFRVYDAGGRIMACAFAREIADAVAPSSKASIPKDAPGVKQNGLPPPFTQTVDKSKKTSDEIYVYSNYPSFKGYEVKWWALPSNDLKAVNYGVEIFGSGYPESESFKFFSATREEGNATSGQQSLTFFPLTDAHGFNLVGGMTYGRGLKMNAEGRLVWAGSFKGTKVLTDSNGAVVLDAQGKPKYDPSYTGVTKDKEFVLSNFSDLIKKAGSKNSDQLKVREQSALTGEFTGGFVGEKKGVALQSTPETQIINPSESDTASHGHGT